MLLIHHCRCPNMVVFLKIAPNMRKPKGFDKDEWPCYTLSGWGWAIPTHSPLIFPVIFIFASSETSTCRQQTVDDDHIWTLTLIITMAEGQLCGFVSPPVPGYQHKPANWLKNTTEAGEKRDHRRTRGLSAVEVCHRILNSANTFLI